MPTEPTPRAGTQTSKPAKPKAAPRSAPKQGPPSYPGQPGYVTPAPAPKPKTTPSPAPRPSASAPAGPSVNGIPRDVYLAIIKAADENGVPRDLALAIAQQESGFNPHSVGDNGTSFGLYQLHEGGELGSMAPTAAYDPYTNASVALKVVGSVYRQHPDWTPGQIAAAAQRPADRAGYAASVNGILHSGTFKAVPASASGSAASGAGYAAGDTYNTATPSNDDIIAQVEGVYGYPASYLRDKEIGPILLAAAKGGWDSARLFGALSKTKWWQTHSAATRTFDAQTQLDPETQKRQIMAQADDIIGQAKKSGFTLDQKAVAQMAWSSLRYGWSSQQLANAIAAQGKMDFSGKTPNAAVATVDDLRQQAAQYMVPVSDGQLQTWARQIAGGQFTSQDFDGYLKEQAKSLFPALAPAIDRGVTVQQYADPYRNMAAQTLEVNPNSIDFMNDPKYSKALFQIDPKTKERTAMSLADWGTYLRGLPEYAKTAQANQQAASMTNSILQTFGAVK